MNEKKAKRLRHLPAGTSPQAQSGVRAGRVSAAEKGGQSMRPHPRYIGKGYTSPNPLSWQYHATKGWRKVAEFSRHALSPHRIEPHQQEKRDPVLNKYRPHYTGRRGIAVERNRRKIASGQIPRSQVLRGRKAA